MNTEDSQKIIKRFYQCIDFLHESGEMRFISDFTKKHNIRYSNFRQAMSKPESNRFQIAWLLYLVKDYGISPEYLLTGKGKMKPAPALVEKKEAKPLSTTSNNNSNKQHKKPQLS